MIVLSAGHYPASPNRIPVGGSEHQFCLDFVGCVCGQLPVYARHFLPTESLSRKITEASNIDDALMFVEVHLNVGGGTGPEVWHHPDDVKGKIAATIIQEELATSWEGGRGIRPRNGNRNDDLVARGFGWLRRLHPIAPAVIVELCFRDNSKDLAKLNRVWHEYSSALAYGIARAEGAIYQ